MSGGRRGGGGGGPRRPYYPNQRFRQYNDGGYNFSSDVSMGSGGSFVYAGANPHPPMGYYRPPRHPYGMGYGPPPPRYHGGGGGYPPHYGRPRPRGHAPFRGRGPRYSGYGRGGGGGGGQYHGKPHPKDFENLFYHPSMFEDPWRHLLPKSDVEDTKEEDTKNNREKPAIKDVTVDDDDGQTKPDGQTEPGGSDSSGAKVSDEDRTGCAEKVEEEKELISSETNGEKSLGDGISASGEQESAIEEKGSDVPGPVEKQKAAAVVAAEVSGTEKGGGNMDTADTTAV